MLHTLPAASLEQVPHFGSHASGIIDSITKSEISRGGGGGGGGGRGGSKCDGSSGRGGGRGGRGGGDETIHPLKEIQSKGHHHNIYSC